MSSYRDTQRFDTIVQALETIDTDLTEADDNSSWILPTFSLILFLVFGALIFWLSTRDTQQTGVRVPCPAGLCVTNNVSGEKMCPETETDQLLLRNVSLQSCNTPRSCTDLNTPFLYYDRNLGSVPVSASNAVCPTDVAPEQCGCTSFRWCPDFATVYFEPLLVNASGTGTGGSDLTKTVFVQKTVWSKPSNVPSSDQPIGLTPQTGSNLTCSLGFNNLQNAWPPLGQAGQENGGCVKGVLIKSLLESGNTEESGVFYCGDKPNDITCNVNQFYVLNTDGTYVCQDY